MGALTSTLSCAGLLARDSHDLLARTGHTALLFGDDTDGTNRTGELLAGHTVNCTIRHISSSETTLMRRLHLARPSVVLVRPDGYIAAVARQDDLGALEPYLTSISTDPNSPIRQIHTAGV